jgi:uncharacterized DUF497 family protein
VVLLGARSTFPRLHRDFPARLSCGLGRLGLLFQSGAIPILYEHTGLPYIMDVEFDEAKDATNVAKHGVSLVLGAVVLENRLGEVIDDRQDYGETRMNAFGLVAGRLFACTYTMRNGAARIISWRRASRQGQRLWLS